MLRSMPGLAAAVLIGCALPAGAEDADYARTGFYLGASVGLGVDGFETKYREGATINESSPPRVAAGYRVISAPDRGFIVGSTVRTVEPRFVGLDVKERIGAHVRAGYRFHPNLSAEVAFEILDGFDIEVTEVVGDIETSSATTDQTSRTEVLKESRSHSLRPMALTANARGHLLTGRIQPYGLVGAGILFARVRNHREAGYIAFNNTFANASTPFPPAETPRKIPDPLTGNQIDFAVRLGGGFEIYATENVVLNLGVSYLLPTGELRELMDYWSIELFGMQYRF